MNKKDNKKSINWTPEERERVVGLFDLLIKMDKKQNPDLYKKSKNKPKMIVLDKDGKEVTL